MQQRRLRSKMSRPPSYRIESDFNPDAMPQYFQISVNILEARKLMWSSPQTNNSYVVVILGKRKHRTSVIKNMDEPFYKEHFIFEMYSSVHDLQRSSLWLAVMEPRCCAPARVLGETSVDLGAIWAQPHHQVLHKWAQLSQARSTSAGPVGFLKVDISIIFRDFQASIVNMPFEEKIHENLIQPLVQEQQKANYLVTVYSAYGLPFATQTHGDRKMEKPPNTLVRVSFCGLTAKTAVQPRSNNPKYCEQISMVELFPNVSDLIRLEVWSTEGGMNRVLASTHLKMGDISCDGENGFLPTFGPSLLHMYGTSSTASLGSTGEDGPYHRGALVVALRTVVPYYQQPVRCTSVEPATPFVPEAMWTSEDFSILCPIFELSMLDKKIAGKHCGVAITIGDVITSKSDDEFMNMMNEIRARKCHYTGILEVVKTPHYGYIHFPSNFPVLQLATRLPDFRHRMYRNNMIYGIVNELTTGIRDAENRMKYKDTNFEELLIELNKVREDAIGNISKFLDILQYSNSNESCGDSNRTYNTDLDQKQMSLQREEIEKIVSRISIVPSQNSVNDERINTSVTFCMCPAKKDAKKLLAELKQFNESIRSVIYNTTEGWPDIVIWLLNGGSRVAYCKVSPADVIFSVISEQSGKYCGRIQTIYMKPLKCPKHMSTLATGCFCIAAKVELMLWMGLYRQISVFEEFLPRGYNLIVKGFDKTVRTGTMMIECRTYIYKAKIFGESAPCTDCASNFYVRINVFNSSKETQEQPSLTPTWDQVLRIRRMICSTRDRLYSSPPRVMVEVFNNNGMNFPDLVGRFQIQAAFDLKQDGAGDSSKLRWYSIHRGVEITGQVLMSVHLKQIAEKVIKTTEYYLNPEEVVHSQDNDRNIESRIERIPSHIVPKSASCKVDVYWWGLRNVKNTKKPCVVLELDDLTIKSEIISEGKPNCNFPHGKVSQTFDGTFFESSCSMFNVRLYDSSTFGRTLFLATNHLKNPDNYVVTWMNKYERDSSLKSLTLKASNSSQGSYKLRTSKSCLSNDFSKQINGCMLGEKPSTKTSLIRKVLFKQPTEEEYTLLPVAIKDQNYVIQKNSKCNLVKSWWVRYYYSSEDQVIDDEININKIKIYDSELERQPEFAKFRDWCTSVKLYSGQKSGIPEKDKEVFCGILKFGIAMYKWPPPENTVAVSPSGVELCKSFFDDYPRNDPQNFLVRVYIVKGIELMSKDFTGKSDPYVIITCGKKQLGDRYEYVSKNLNPVFGRVYEFRCNLPDDYLLQVSVYDYEDVPPDQLIGSTEIDLEDRIYTKHRARVGLASEYNTSGPDRWRDSIKPSHILEEVCSSNHLPSPLYTDPYTVLVNGVEYKAPEDMVHSSPAICKEYICLTVLQQWQTLPVWGYKLVPEHIETRSLYHPDKHGFEQGKIQMWIDIYPLGNGAFIPRATDISAHKTDSYELRLDVGDLKDARYMKTSDKAKSNLLVKAWLGTKENLQKSDIFFSSKAGEVMFNWKMIFRFQYIFSDRRLFFREIGAFTEYEETAPPYLHLVIVQYDERKRREDAIGKLSLDLNSMPFGAYDYDLVSIEDNDTSSKKINLFIARNIKGWFPLEATDVMTGNKVAAGAIDLDINLLTEEEAKRMPAAENDGVYGMESTVSLCRNAPRSSESLTRSRPKSKGIFNRRPYRLVAMVMGFLILLFCFLPYFYNPTIETRVYGTPLWVGTFDPRFPPMEQKV